MLLFGIGCEFLVCRKEFNKFENNWHIWLREVRTGLGQNVILWIDDEIFPKQNDKYQNHNQ